MNYINSDNIGEYVCMCVGGGSRNISFYSKETSKLMPRTWFYRQCISV